MKLASFLQSGSTDQPFCFVMGNPVEHSYSPEIHNFAARQYGLDWTYHKVEVLEDELEEASRLFHLKHFTGANITIPHKRSVIPYLDIIRKSAQEAGAVNTIVKKAGIISGYNTDEYGFSQPLLQFADILKHGTAIVFGSGGACAAVVYALMHHFHVNKIYVVTRNKSACNSQTELIQIISYASVPDVIATADIIINSTPLGMGSFKDNSPLDPDLLAEVKSKICFDLIYNPLRTRFLKECGANGAITINGLPMFIHQAAKAFELWTGKEFPIDEAENLLINKLKVTGED
ncbi:MAG: shikimate dehydrogenase [Rhodothermaceae bacterium]|nr:shikimate dehydrogenase [Rhodothermaceae bacterium]